MLNVYEFSGKQPQKCLSQFKQVKGILKIYPKRYRFWVSKSMSFVHIELPDTQVQNYTADTRKGVSVEYITKSA